MGTMPAGTAVREDYLAYLLRIWREGKDPTTWRASLQNPHTGEQLGFGSVDEMLGFLQRQLGLRPGAPADPAGQKREENGGPPGL